MVIFQDNNKLSIQLDLKGQMQEDLLPTVSSDIKDSNKEALLELQELQLNLWIKWTQVWTTPEAHSKNKAKPQQAIFQAKCHNDLAVQSQSKKEIYYQQKNRKEWSAQIQRRLKARIITANKVS